LRESEASILPKTPKSRESKIPHKHRPYTPQRHGNGVCVVTSRDLHVRDGRPAEQPRPKVAY